MKTLTSVILILFTAVSVFAQDLAYNNCENTTTSFYGKDVNRIGLIANGATKTGNLSQQQNYNSYSRTNAIKIDFMYPLFGCTELIFEQSARLGRSWELALGIVGLGNDFKNHNPSGIYGKFAYKIMLFPDSRMNPQIYSQVLRGIYFAPEIGLRTVSYDTDDYQRSDDREKQSSVAFTVKFGKQWIFYDSFVIDAYGGFGYGFNSNDDKALPYGFYVAKGDFPIAFSWGLRFGFVFGR